MDKLAYFLLAFYVLYSYGYVFVTLAAITAQGSIENISKATAFVYLVMFIFSPIFCPMFAGAKEAGK